MARRSSAAALGLLAILYFGCSPKPRPRAVERQLTQQADPADIRALQADTSGITKVFMHNVLLRKGPILRVRIKWLRGFLRQTYPKVPVSLDNVSSFNIQAQDGQVAATLEELAKFATQSGITSGNLSDLQFVNDAGRLRLQARYRKLFPIQVDGDVSPSSSDLIRVHIAKIDVLKLPVKALLHVFHLSAADLIDTKHVKGIEVQKDDIYVDLAQLLPPPHIRGIVTSVKVVGNDLTATFGNADPEVLKREEWRNYLRLRGGNLIFGKLQMTDADMIMIDTSADEWFDLDLDHYQQQMVYGYSRITPDAGLQVFMPDVSTIASLKKRIDMDWVKHRGQSPPSDVLPH
jgi:hypothetical protein